MRRGRYFLYRKRQPVLAVYADGIIIISCYKSKAHSEYSTKTIESHILMPNS